MKRGQTTGAVDRDVVTGRETDASERGKDGRRRRQMAQQLTRDYWEKGMSGDV